MNFLRGGVPQSVINEVIDLKVTGHAGSGQRQAWLTFATAESATAAGDYIHRWWMEATVLDIEEGYLDLIFSHRFHVNQYGHRFGLTFSLDSICYRLKVPQNVSAEGHRFVSWCFLGSQ